MTTDDEEVGTPLELEVHVHMAPQTFSRWVEVAAGLACLGVALLCFLLSWWLVKTTIF